MVTISRGRNKLTPPHVYSKLNWKMICTRVVTSRSQAQLRPICVIWARRSKYQNSVCTINSNHILMTDWVSDFTLELIGVLISIAGNGNILTLSKVCLFLLFVNIFNCNINKMPNNVSSIELQFIWFKFVPIQYMWEW